MLKPFLCVSLLAVFSVFIQDFPPYKGDPCMTTQETAVRETSAKLWSWKCSHNGTHFTAVYKPIHYCLPLFQECALEC